MEQLHQRLIALGLEATAAHGFALAGGYAVQAHQVVARLSDDVDLFTSWERRGELAAATQRLVDAYTEAGFAVRVEEASDGYARLLVSEPDATTDGAGAFTKVELAADVRLNPPVQMSVGPVLHRDDVAAGKVGALFTRAAARDYIDVASLVLGGHYSREQLLNLAAERDGGFDTEVFAQMLAGFARYKDIDFLRYGLTEDLLACVRAEIDSWYQQLTGSATTGTDRTVVAGQSGSLKRARERPDRS